MQAEKEQLIGFAHEVMAEIKCKEEHLKIPVVVDVTSKVIETFELSEFNGIWNKQIERRFYELVNACNKEGRPLVDEKELFRINVGLDYVLRLLQKRADLRVRSWPSVRLSSRQYLAVEYKQEIISCLPEYHDLLQTLISKSANFGINQQELYARVILSMIALDGVLVANADGCIAGLEKQMVHLHANMPFIELPFSSRKRGVLKKHYYLCEYTCGCLRILLPRAKGKGSIFPRGWEMTNDHHKKRPRRIFLRKFLSDLWLSTFPDRPIPEYLDVDFWIKASRKSIALNGVPFVALAHLRNRLRGAQIPVCRDTSCSVANASGKSGEIEKGPFQYVQSLHRFLADEESKKDDKLRIKNVPILKQRFKEVLEDSDKTALYQPDEVVLVRWLVWMLSQKRFKDMRLSTFRGYISSVSNRVFPLPDNKSLIDLDRSEWIQMVTDLALNEDYMPSSRRTAITHLKVLNQYLHEQDLAPEIDFSNYAFRVPRDIAECDVIFPHEIDLVLEGVDSDNQWLALLLAFYCGLRCEEICYLRPESFESDYRLIISRSKLASSRRTIPYGLLIPGHHRERMEVIISSRRVAGAAYLLEENGQNPVPTWKLSKQIGRLLVRVNSRVQKMHALRHGFASWQLVRYFMLVDSEFRADVRARVFHSEVEGEHSWFNDESLADLAEVFGGIQWRIGYEKQGGCSGNATDAILISKLNRPGFIGGVFV